MWISKSVLGLDVCVLGILFFLFENFVVVCDKSYNVLSNIEGFLVLRNDVLVI